MLAPLEFNLTPSCFECLSWSSDGDLAVAAGDQVHILTPKPSSAPQDASSVQDGAQQWHFFKIQTSLFTYAEWPAMQAQSGGLFSIGEEQSPSRVVALAWSQPGLVPYGRCALAVLTSNLLLSLWQAEDGHGQWRRVAIVNHALRDHFRPLIKEGSVLLHQKQRVRSFSWSPPYPVESARRQPEIRPASLQNGGTKQLLIITNDLADVVILEIQNGPHILRADVLSTFQLQKPRDPYPQVQPNTILASSLKQTRIIRHVCWDPWVQGNIKEDERGITRYVSKVAMLNGQNLDLLHVEVAKPGETKDKLEVGVSMAEQSISTVIERISGTVDLKGPLSWVHGDDNETICLVVGTLDGCLSIKLTQSEYTKTELDLQEISVHKHIFVGPTNEGTDGGSPDWFPVTGIIQARDPQFRAPSLQVVNLSSHTISLSSHTMESIPPWTSDEPDQQFISDWQKQTESFRSQYDLDYDLGGMSMVQTWGLASFRGWVAACFTLHPTNLFDRTTAAKRTTRMVFARPHAGEDVDVEGQYIPWLTPRLGPEELVDARGRTLAFILDPSHQIPAQHDKWLRRLLYAASCCVIVQADQYPQLLPSVKSTLQWLIGETGLDLSHENSLIDTFEAQPVTDTEEEASKTTIAAKSPEELSIPAAEQVFETCDICGTGIEWYSPTESQCAEGHVFVRCGVTFLSIQDPSSAKRCARCGIEVFNPGADEQSTQTRADAGEAGPTMLDHVLEAFHTCVYCDGKFRG